MSSSPSYALICSDGEYDHRTTLFCGCFDSVAAARERVAEVMHDRNVDETDFSLFRVGDPTDPIAREVGDVEHDIFARERTAARMEAWAAEEELRAARKVKAENAEQEINLARIEAAAQALAAAVSRAEAAGHGAAVAPGRLAEMDIKQLEALTFLMEDIAVTEGPTARSRSAVARRTAFNLKLAGSFLLPDMLAAVEAKLL
jgi:hypothetical protein